ncbi:hypothetical protein CYMTET_49677 [Cymbomonas tetramitiformis]|uniref:Uncharacterized protein n=1 Tax=Cymbomonas tetramitiformis TaxID=36881 RepID=A0AAE0BRE6_9CHLO|nr:hypothetical protein CYMTET_49677 [Cymbomonas tetramitiformis]
MAATRTLTAGQDTYLLYGSSELKGRIKLTRFNLFGKANLLFRRFGMQRKFASFRNTLKRMVRTGKYVFVTDFILDGRGLSEERCEATCKMLIMSALTRDSDISDVLFPGFNSKFDKMRYFDNQLTTSSSGIVQMTYEDFYVSLRWGSCRRGPEIRL